MDKNAIKKYAVWARREMISRVSTKALQYGITEKDCGNPRDDSVNGTLLTAAQKKQRQALIAQIKEKGYREVMEEVAYTWFNRFSALRFMEVNGYLPTHVRVFTDEDNAFRPQIITEAIHLEMDGLDMEKVYAYKDADEKDELYKYLLISQCNALSPILPGMFQKIEDYTELLFPDNLLREGSAIEQMIALIPEEDWMDAVQIIGWLYQYYNAEKKDDVFAALKKNVKITKENIPAATQLFTPDWIVRYMVENSLGRLWLEGHPNAELQGDWKYYLEEAEQEPEVQNQLTTIRKEYEGMKPEDIKCIDPCCGSGHILAYLFDVLVQIYEAYGYTTREAVRNIVENNLYGLDIDDRAAQLANFAVMMKARQYDRRFFAKKDEYGNLAILQPHVYAIQESNHIDKFAVEYFWNHDSKLEKAINYVIRELHDAKEYGSILNITPLDWTSLYARFDEIRNDINMSREAVLNELIPLVKIAEVLVQKYDVVVTNPPYMSSSGMSAKLGDYVKKNYSNSKSDLFACFIERCGQMAGKNSYQAMITQHAWMFLSSFESLRAKLLQVDTVNMAHLGARAFEEIGGEVVQTTAFVMRISHVKKYKGVYCRLTEPTTQQGKEDLFLTGERCYVVEQDNFSKIPAAPIAYWISEKMLSAYSTGGTLNKIAAPRAGLATGDNNIFQRLWYEVEVGKIGFCCSDVSETRNVDYRWYPCNSGGEFRKWSTNDEYVVDWENDGQRLKQFRNSAGKLAARPQNTQFYFKEGVTWNKLSSSRFAVKYKRVGYVYDDTSRSAFIFDNKQLPYLIGLLCSTVTFEYLKALNPTMSFTNGDLERIPYIYSEDVKGQIDKFVQENIAISKADWDSFETSWDFARHPLLSHLLSDVYDTPDTSGSKHWLISNNYQFGADKWDKRFNQLKANEEELNRIFIDIYGLADELTPEVEDKDVTVRKADLQRDIKSLISYAVGCMFGRYSLDVDGLAYAGGEWDESKYKQFPADKDNIIPICDDEYFEDDIVGRFVKFIEVVYGKETLDANLKFIADALGGKGQPKDVIRAYFINGFYADHLKIYQKRPIYWLFDSGKKNGFKALIYIHRYQPDSIARIRTDYVHEQQGRYRTAIADLQNQIESASKSERVKLTKKLTALQAQADEILAYEEKIHHLADQMISIDLDDGVKKNYEIFRDVLAKKK